MNSQKLEAWWTKATDVSNGLTITTAFGVLYLLIMLAFYSHAGGQLGALVIAPVTIAAWTLGIRSGLISAAIFIVINFFIYLSFEGDATVALRFSLGVGSLSTFLVAAIVGALRTLSGRLEAQSRKQAELEKANRELEQFAYVAAHDLKSPLRGISNLAQWLEEDLQTAVTPEHQRYFQLLHGRVQRMEALVEGLRLYYTPPSLKIKPPDSIDVHALAQHIVKKVKPPALFHVEIDTDVVDLAADRSQLEQVLLQLVDNALRHHDKESGGVLISVREQEEFCLFSVTDDGPGIDPRYHQKVFAIFQTLQARDQVESVGIGLPLAKKLVEASGGTIWLESDVGQGAAFYFTWPKENGR